MKKSRSFVDSSSDDVGDSETAPISFHRLVERLKKKIATGAVGPGELLIIGVVAAVMFGGPRIVSIGRGLLEGFRMMLSGLRYER